MTPPAKIPDYLLLSKARLYQSSETLYRVGFIRAVGDDLDGGAADDAQGQYAQQALRIDTALFLLDPDGGFVFIRLLDEESGGTCVQTGFVLN